MAYYHSMSINNKGGGGLVNQLKKSYSLSDLSGIGSELARVANSSDEVDDSVGDIGVVRRRTQKERRSPHRSSSASASAVYFSEVDINVLTTGCAVGDEVRSTEDISSGYSSGEFSQRQAHNKETVSSSKSQASMKARPTRVTRSSSRSKVPSKKQASISDDSDEDEVFDTNIVFFNDKAKQIRKLVDSYEKLSKSDSDNERNDPLFDTCDDSPSTFQHENNSSTIACPLPVFKREDLSNNNRNLNIEKNRHEKLINTTQEPIKKGVQTVPNDKLLNADDLGKRGGRYHKKMAPPPPAGAIKATLVLQPGIVRQYLSKSAEDVSAAKELFLRTGIVNKRCRSRSKSPANYSTRSSSNSSTLQRFLKIPKKVNDSLKRKSWGDFFLGKKMENVIVRNAKSTSNLSRISSIDLPHRRLKIIKNYVDEDID